MIDEKRLQEEYQRFSSQQSRLLTENEIILIRQLSQDIPALWSSNETTNAQRKEIVRQIVLRIVVQAEGRTEKVNIEVEWAGGHLTHAVFFRPVGKLCDLSYYPQLCKRIRALSSQGHKAVAIAEQINREGFQPAKRQRRFSTQSIQSLMRRLNVSRPRRAAVSKPPLPTDQRWLSDLANTLDMPAVTLYNWLQKGWIQGKQETFSNKRWIVYASLTEIVRLKQLRQQLKQGNWPSQESTVSLFTPTNIEKI